MTETDLLCLDAYRSTPDHKRYVEVTNAVAFNLKHCLYQMVALLIDWTILLAVTGLLDELCNIETHLIMITWLCIGIGIMLLKKIDFPFPLLDRIDVPSAFTMLGGLLFGHVIWARREIQGNLFSARGKWTKIQFPEMSIATLSV